ncbi:TPA: hypothetical protein ACQRX0_002031 [Acinetobacter baumannii]|nr:hypothetical protein [Acinetobacter baumannii]EKW2430353.1 hypothetical protein [Acinetobacter baumannii]ELY0556986.1 hypothetical protein [Acinetobacter baumannii]MBU0386650.1 hypothetical protein [Acinetobacter baumannii]MCQ1077040.1 hypothetical protein [Acinetobacter baumannii]MCW1490182.1 hypothetical protein [Acinetobacter baumannii]
MNNSETDLLHSSFQQMGLDPSYFEEEENDDPIPYIIEQLGIHERFVLHYYKCQKVAYSDLLLTHPDDFANAVQDEAFMYQATFGMSDHIHVLTPYDDYLYLRDELLKNPFEIGTKPEELLLAYVFCLCKDTRQKLWKGEIENCKKDIKYIEKLLNKIRDLTRTIYELWSKNPHEIPTTHKEMAYNYPVANEIRYIVDPDYDKSIHTALGKKKTSLLREWRIFQFKELLKKTAAKEGGWKSVNAAAEAMASFFIYQLEKQAIQTAKLFKTGRKDFIKLYNHALIRLQIELEDNAWLNNHPSNQERRELAEQKMVHLNMLIEEQQNLYDALELNENSEVDIDGYQNLLKASYDVDTLSDWIRGDKVLLEQILLKPNSSKKKTQSKKII